MTRPYFIDADIPIYAAGSAHPLKDPAIRILRLAAQHPESFLTSAEVLQELIRIVSADQNLDRIPWLERLDPKNVADLTAQFA